MKATKGNDNTIFFHSRLWLNKDIYLTIESETHIQELILCKDSKLILKAPTSIHTAKLAKGAKIIGEKEYLNILGEMTEYVD